MTKGLLKNVSVSGHQADYSYDTMDRLTKVAGKAAVNGTETDVQVQYTYDRDRLTKITHNGFDYTFAYDGIRQQKECVHCRKGGGQMIMRQRTAIS